MGILEVRLTALGSCLPRVQRYDARSSYIQLKIQTMLDSHHLKRRLLEAGIYSSEELRGCNEEEINEIQRNVKRPLPKSYKQIMRTIGKCGGEFMNDIVFFYPATVTLTPKCREQISEYVELPNDVFVFASRFKEQILMTLEPGDDPPVVKWSYEESAELNHVLPSIWDFIEEELSAEEEWRKRRKK